MPNMAAWVDTGFLVALFARNDPHHTSAVEFLANHQRLSLHSLWPVVTETGFFLDTSGKIALLSWLECHGIILHDLSVTVWPPPEAVFSSAYARPNWRCRSRLSSKPLIYR